MKIQLSDHFTYKKLLRFCLSPILMMLFVSVYGVVDGWFISNYVGKNAFAAINLIYPAIFVLSGFGFMVGTGGSALVAKTLGEGKKEQASEYFTMMVKFVFLVGMLTSFCAILFLKPIARFLGAGEDLMRDCLIYGGVCLMFNPAYMLQNIFQNFLTTAEKPKIALYATVAAGLSNMVLDALFIAVFHFGVLGAALATGISQLLGALIPICYFAHPNSSGLIRFKKAKTQWKILFQACFNGMSEMLSAVSSSVVGMVYNFRLLEFAGEDGVSAFGVLMYMQFIFIAVFIGYTIGMMPIVGYHYGAKNQKELQNIFKKSVVLTLSLGALMAGLSTLIAHPIADFFVGYDRALLDMTAHSIRIYAFAFLFIGFNIFSSSFFTALNDGKTSAAISFLRTFLFQILSVVLLPMIFELEGIWWAGVAAEILAFISALTFFLAKRKKYHYM